MLRWFPNSMQPSLSKLIKITPCCRTTKLIYFQIISTLSNESWNQVQPSLSQASTTHHPNVFTPILSLSEGRAGIAWVPSNKILFFPLRYTSKAPLAFPQMFSLYFYSYTILSDSLSLSLFVFRGLIGIHNYFSFYSSSLWLSLPALQPPPTLYDVTSVARPIPIKVSRDLFHAWSRIVDMCFMICFECDSILRCCKYSPLHVDRRFSGACCIIRATKHQESSLYLLDTMRMQTQTRFLSLTEARRILHGKENAF
jgi:hypothetical protein